MKSIDATIIDTTYFSQNFPSEIAQNKIERDNYLLQFKSELDTYKVLFIEGEEDSGKTTLLAEFVNSHKRNSVSIFFNPLNKIDYDIDYFFQNLNAQLNFLITSSIDAPSGNTQNISSFRALLHQLRKKYKNKSDKFYLVIDGLDHNFDSNKELIKEIFETIPLGDDFIKIIITGSLYNFNEEIKQLTKCKCKNITVLGLTKEEVKKIVNIEDDSVLEKIFKITKGLPGRLQTFNRLLSKNHNIDELIEHETYNNYINLDCSNIDLGNEKIEVLLSLLSFSDESLNTDQILEITQINQKELSKFIEETSIIEEKENINFISNSHKKFFTNKLRNNKSKTRELLIKYYTDSKTINSKYELFKIFREKEQWSKIQEIVDQDFILSLIENTGSLKKVNDSIESVYQASSQLKNYPSTFKYSIIGSILNELDSYTFWESEILARLSIDDYEGAINLAESAVLKIDRLRLLSLIAKKQKESNKSVDNSLSNVINELYKSTDLSDAGVIIYDIVANLLYAIPNLAIEIIENSSSSAKSNNINNWIIAKLSLAAITTSGEEGEKKIDAINKLNNPSIEKINRAITFLVGNYSAEKVLREVKKMKDSNERIHLLRMWLSNNKFNIDDSDKAQVINYSLDEIVSSSKDLTINFEILKDLSSLLPHIKNYDTKSKILARFKSLESHVSNIGVSKDKFIYELNIFHTQYKLSSDKSITIINDIIKNIETIDDILIKLESYSEVYAKIFNIANLTIKKKKSFVYHKINELSASLLNQSANHYNSLTNVIKTISFVDPLLALDITNNVNTLINRDRLRILVLEEYLKNSINKIDFDKIRVIQISIETTSFKEVITKILLERLNEAETLPKEVIQNLLFFTNEIKNFKISPASKIMCYNLQYKVINKNEFWKTNLAKGIKKNIDSEFSKIDREWEKIDIGYRICSDLADVDKSFSKNKFDAAEEIKNNTWLDSEFIAQVYINTISLTVRAFEGVMTNKESFDKEFNMIERLILNIPSELEKITLWTQLAISSYLNDKIEFAKKIYDKHIFPSVTILDNKSLKIQDSIETLILVNIFNSSLAKEIIKKLPYFYKEDACHMISNFYLSKKNPFNYYEGDIYNNSIELQDIYNTISILELAEMDNSIFSIISNIYRTEFYKTFTKIQIADIIEKLTTIIETKLPDNKNIKHDGYKIISKLKVILLNKNASNNELKQLYEQAENLDNISDRLFVKSQLLDNLPFNRVNFANKKDIFDDIINDLQELPNNYEFVDRVSQISEIMLKVERIEWKNIIDKAFKFSKDIEEGSEAYDFQKKMIDSLYRVDEAIAKDLVNSIDKENNDSKQKRILKRYYDTLEITNKIRNNKTIEQKENDDIKVLISSIQKTLGSLNSGKTTIKKIEDVAKYLFIGYKVPLLNCIPIFIYYFSSCAKTQFTKNSNNEFSRINEKNFNEMVLAS
ncbi:TPA: hypothetical protein ACRFJD_003673, partial [Elizabethkingia anophelis]